MFQLLTRGKIDGIAYSPTEDGRGETSVLMLVVNEYYDNAPHDNLYLVTFDKYQTERLRKIENKIKYITVRCDRVLHRVVAGKGQTPTVEVWLQGREWYS